MTTQPHFFLSATNALLPKSGDFIFTTVKMSTTSINSRAKLITSGEIDFRCDLTTDSFFTKWGVENNLEQHQLKVFPVRVVPQPVRKTRVVREHVILSKRSAWIHRRSSLTNGIFNWWPPGAIIGDPDYGSWWPLVN